MTKTKDDFKIKGSFIATLRHKDGSVEVRRKDNLILNGGLTFQRCCFFDTTPPSGTILIFR